MGDRKPKGRHIALSRGPAQDAEQALGSRLHLDPEAGAIHFDGFRMLLLYSTLLARLKTELANQCGDDRAKQIWERLGHAEGTKIALLANEKPGGASFAELMETAREVWGLTGNARASLLRADTRPGAESFEIEVELENSIEAHAHLEAYGLARAPICWLQTGAASGLFTAYFGWPVVFTEEDCVARGDPKCKLVGKRFDSPEAEDNAAGAYLRTDELINRFAMRRGQSQALPDPITDVVGVSPSFLDALEQVRRVAPTRATVLLEGETGTGKEVFAALLHKMSDRASRSFVAVNCAAIPDSLAEAELFGVEKGAYTGAHNARGGHFERADGGTLFLDEVASLSLAVQAKLLRVLEDRSVGRLGGHRSRLVDVRVIAACNEDLRGVVTRGQFREDLYFRLCVYPIRVPPLRERRDDIPLLIQHFVRLYQGMHNKRAGLITGRALRLLLQYDYPGNVRELEHMIERAVIRATHDEPLDLSHLDFARTPVAGGAPNDASLSRARKNASVGGIDTEASAAADPNVAVDNQLSLKEVEETLLKRALNQHHGNRAAAARALKISRRQFNYRLAKYGAA